MKKIIVLIVLAFVLAGCTGLGPKFTEQPPIPNGKSVVYFYRLSNPLTVINNPGLVENEQEILSSLPTWSWWPYYIEPGTHHFEPDLFGLYKKENLTIKSQRHGEKHFVRLNVDFGYVGLEKIGEEQAVSEMAKCYLVQKNNKGHVANKSKHSTSTPKVTNTEESTSLEKIEPKTARLYVDTDPAGSRVRIMNIKPKFAQGIELEPGKYKIETSSPGYIKDLRWIEITEKGDFKLSVALNKQ